MGITERKEREKKQRVDTILEAAQQVLTEKGMEAATVNDVALQAELGKGTLYLYFKSKDEILQALCNEALEELQASFVKATKNKKTGLEKMTAIGMAYFEFYKKSPLKFQLINYLNHSTPETGEAPSIQMQQCLGTAQKTIGYMVECILQGMEDKSISKHIDPLQTALLCWSASTGVIQSISVHGDYMKKDFGINANTFTSYYFSLMNSMLKEYKP
ncbi:MAG: TetR/AcrR family transcriptional regulator [Flavobacteriales bacterium]